MTFSAVFQTWKNCRPEVSIDIISGVALDYVSMDALAKFGDSGLNTGRTIRLFGRPDLSYAPLCSIYLYFAATEAPSDVISGKSVTIRDKRCLNRSR